MESKLDKISENINEIKITLAEQHVTLKEHVRRTEILEAEIKPLKAHVQGVHLVLKLIGVASMLGAAVEGAMSVLEYFKK